MGRTFSPDVPAPAPPSTGAIVGGVLAGLIVAFSLFILYRLVRRTRRKLAAERALEEVEKAVVVEKRASAEGTQAETETEAEEKKSSAQTHTVDTDHNEAHISTPSGPPKHGEDDARRPVPPLAGDVPSATLQPPPRVSAISDLESTSATSFATAMQSQRNSANTPSS
jgi:hypothetical protein